MKITTLYKVSGAVGLIRLCKSQCGSKLCEKLLLLHLRSLLQAQKLHHASRYLVWGLPIYSKSF